MLTRTMAAFFVSVLALGVGPVATASEDMPAPASEWAASYAEARLVLQELKADVEALRRLRAAQKELVEWNTERARLGLSAETLRPELCLDAENERWCRLFPATFGVGEGRE